mmetsp:Transcript_30165/g.86393  ORF Transcript_30165/g.86393 Transcript_30165/m.86393 type:complete len:460 (+) Transcript_30165:138-1517(+)
MRPFLTPNCITGGWFSFASQADNCVGLRHDPVTDSLSVEAPKASRHAAGHAGGDQDCAGPGPPGPGGRKSRGVAGTARRLAPRPRGLPSLSMATSQDSDVEAPLVSPGAWQAAVVATESERDSPAPGCGRLAGAWCCCCLSSRGSRSLLMAGVPWRCGCRSCGCCLCGARSCHGTEATGRAVCWWSAADSRSCCDADRHRAEAAAVVRDCCAIVEHGCTAVENERATATIFGTIVRVAPGPAVRASATIDVNGPFAGAPCLAVRAAGCACTCPAGAGLLVLDATLAPAAARGVVAVRGGAAVTDPARTVAEEKDLATAVVTVVVALAGLVVGGGAADAPGTAAEDADLATAADFQAHAGAGTTFMLTGIADSIFAGSDSTVAGPMLGFAWCAEKILFDGTCGRREDAGGEHEGAATRAPDDRRAKATGEEERCTGLTGKDANFAECKHVEFGLDRAAGD